MPKTYVLDTNVLLADSEAIFKFEDNNIEIPICVLEEMDRFKKEMTEIGRNARQTARNLDALRELGDLSVGVKLPSGGTIRVAVALSRVLCKLPLGLDENIPDNQILAVAVDCHGILVSRDVNLRIKASAVGVPAEDYKHTAVKVDEFYTGTGRGWVSGEHLSKIYSDKKLNLEDVTLVDMEVPYPNQCITVYSMDNEKQAALTRYDAVMKEFVLLPADLKTLGLIPKNAEQSYALDLLLDPNVDLVTISGKAGSGKTLLSIAAALHGVTETKQYKKILLFKPIVSMDNSHELGFLPGDLKSKLDPWMQSFHDAFSYLMGSPTYEEPPKVRKGKKKEESWEDKSAAFVSPADELIALGLLEQGSLENVRGRSIPDVFLIIDEVQNLSNHAVKTIITRAGEGSKVVLLADTAQTDLPYLSEENNGFVYTVEAFKDSYLSGHMTLQRSVRSKLAEEAANRL
jgi:PhoH-like ATPase